MQFSTAFWALPVLALSTATTAAPFEQEFYNLGCPDSTKPYASPAEQLEAITKFGQLLYLQKEVETAEYTYVARDFINHAPEIPGNGRELAIQALVPMLATSTVEIKNVYAGARNATGSEFSVTYFKGTSSVFGVGVIADIWRMIGTCLVEHWDVAMGVENSTNPLAYF